METVYRDFSAKGVRFYYVYKALAHPELNGYVTPFTLEERLQHVQMAKRTLGSKIPWLCDTMGNELKHALGNRPNSELVFDPEGKIVRFRSWSQPEALRRDLEELVGKLDHEPTRVSDLDMPVQVPSREIPSGVVPRVAVPGQMTPLRIQPDLTAAGKTPFYVKLRAEVTREFFQSRSGRLYLGFHLDPIHRVHWNNLAAPLEFELEGPAGVRVTPSRGTGPKVKASADRDPREFLLDLSSEDLTEPMKLTVRYFACDDADTFCVPVTQSYAVWLERDPDGGNARRSAGRGQPGREMAEGMVERWLSRDTNGDGKISLAEAPPPMRQRFDLMDADGDGLIDQDEMRAAVKRMQGQGRPPRR